MVGLVGMGETIGALLVEFRGFGSRSSSERRLNGTNQGNRQGPLTKMHSSSGTEHAASKGVSEYNGKPRGLGIVSKKFRHRRFQNKMTRVTEVSENVTNLTSAVEPDFPSEPVANITSVEVIASTEKGIYYDDANSTTTYH